MTHPIHILLRGPSGVGKSTLIQGLLDETGLRPGGFITQKDAPDCEGVCASYIWPAACPETARTYAESNRVGSCVNRHRIDEKPEVFDALGAQYLRDTDGADLLLMDELGFMENKALTFQAEVLRALDGDLPVLAAVKTKDTPFLSAVCAHPRARVYNLTEENRDRLYEQLLPLLRRFTPSSASLN